LELGLLRNPCDTLTTFLEKNLLLARWNCGDHTL